MTDAPEILYSKDCYIVFEGGNNDYIIYNTNKPFEIGHSHIKSKRRVREVIEYSISKTFPLHWSSYFLETMIRLTTDKVFRDRLIQLRETRKSKGRRDRYYNVGGGRR